jgi:hypothetical protein
MGLKGGPNGAKAVFRDRFASAHCGHPKLAEVRLAHGRRRNETLLVVDGNVLMMGIPAAIDTFDGYVGVIATQLGAAVSAAAHVVVVFDEPEHLTKAKQQEQRKRDAQRSGRTPVSSSDLSACPTTDDYDLAMLKGVRIEDAPEGAAVVYTEGYKRYAVPPANTKLLMNHRAARARFHDAVCVAALEYLQRNMDGNGAWSLSFDGVDGRGAGRPTGTPRELGVLSSDPDLWGPLLARDDPIGEGDMKLTDVTAKVHARAVAEPDGALGMVSLNLLWTIDTDSLLIELMQQARRRLRDGPEPVEEAPVFRAPPATPATPEEGSEGSEESEAQDRKRAKKADADADADAAAETSAATAAQLMRALLQASTSGAPPMGECGCAPKRVLPLGAKCGDCKQYAFKKRSRSSWEGAPAGASDPIHPDVAEGFAREYGEVSAEAEGEGEAEAEAPPPLRTRQREKTVLCLREPARKRKGEPAQPAYFLCVDMTKLLHVVLRYIWGRDYADRASLEDQRRAVLLFAGGVLLCGCDFVEIAGASAASMLEEVREVIRGNPSVLATMDAVTSGSGATTVLAAAALQQLVESFVAMAAGNSRLRKQAAKVGMGSTELQLRRACWTLAYWSGYEFKDVHAFGFAADRSSDADAGPSAVAPDEPEPDEPPPSYAESVLQHPLFQAV